MTQTITSLTGKSLVLQLSIIQFIIHRKPYLTRKGGYTEQDICFLNITEPRIMSVNNFKVFTNISEKLCNLLVFVVKKSMHKWLRNCKLNFTFLYSLVPIICDSLFFNSLVTYGYFSVINHTKYWIIIRYIQKKIYQLYEDYQYNSRAMHLYNIVIFSYD